MRATQGRITSAVAATVTGGRRRGLLSALGAVVLVFGGGVPCPAQQVSVTTTEGEEVVGDLVGVAGRGREANLRIKQGADVRSLPLARVIAMHGLAPQPVNSAVAYLVGGDQLRGDLVAGDAAGESFTIRSRSLGELIVPIDRLEAVILPGAETGARLDEFQLPEGAKSDEALFRKARRGYDTIVGAIHRFTSSGVLFEWANGSDPELFRYSDLAAVALRGGVPREGAADAQLVTRSGDVLSFNLDGYRNGELVCQIEGERTLSIPVADVACITFLGEGRRFLSDMEPIRVEERGAEFEEGEAPLFAHRRDRAATGGFLVVGGQTHGKGIGAHSYSELVYRVPEGFDVFSASVGIDDSVLATPVRGFAIVRVKVDGEVAWEQEVRGGDPAREVRVPVTPGALLALEVDFGDGWFLGDRVDWLSAVLLRK